MTKSYPHARLSLAVDKKFKTKKSLGQNFLVNENIYRFMAKEIALQENETIIEVGPGEGVLTEYLAKGGNKIIAVEKDRRLIPLLQEKFKNQKNVTIIEEDILKFDPRSRFDLFEDLRSNLGIFNYKLVGNIPYYLTSHLIKVVLEEWPKPKLILFMVQKEVAQRITAQPPRMNLLALSVQFFAEVKIVKNVSRGNFRPTPKVDSALIKIVPKLAPEFLTKNCKIKTVNFFKLARAAFAGKRKQILNSLVNNLKLTRVLTAEKLAEAGIDPARRPESLSVEEWKRLTQAFWPEQLSA